MAKEKTPRKRDAKQFTRQLSLSDEIAEILRDRIIKGEYAIGEKIVEIEVANELKVSRTPVREAFKTLQDEGLMQYIPNRGCFAKGFTKQDMRDIYQVRKSLEQLAVEWCIENITDEELEDLAQTRELMEFYTLKNDKPKLMVVNREFHEKIDSITKSRFLAQILKSYQEYVKQARKVTVSEEGYLDEILQEHIKIFDAIKNKNIPEAVEMAGIHMDNSRKRAEAKWGITD